MNFLARACMYYLGYEFLCYPILFSVFGAKLTFENTTFFRQYCLSSAVYFFLNFFTVSTTHGTVEIFGSKNIISHMMESFLLHILYTFVTVRPCSLACQTIHDILSDSLQEFVNFAGVIALTTEYF